MPGTPHQTRSRATAQPIHDRLSGGDPRTLRNVEEVVEIALAEPERLDELIRCVLESDDEIVRMRAGDALEKVCRPQPPLLQPHVWLLLGAMSRIHQHSVQWHVAQMLGHVRLTPAQRRRAAGLMNNNLDESADWIVLNYSLDTLAVLARQDPASCDVMARATTSRSPTGPASFLSSSVSAQRYPRPAQKANTLKGYRYCLEVVIGPS